MPEEIKPLEEDRRPLLVTVIFDREYKRFNMVTTMDRDMTMNALSSALQATIGTQQQPKVLQGENSIVQENLR